MKIPDGPVFSCQIGDEEAASLRLVLDGLFSERKNSAVVRRGIKNVQAQFDDIDRLTLGHDIIHCYCRSQGVRLAHLRQALEDEKPGKWDTFWRGTDRPTMRYELFGQHPTTGQWRWEEERAKKAVRNLDHFLQSEATHKTLDQWYAENLQAGVDLDFVRLNDEGVVQYYVPPQSFRLVSDNWLDIPASGTLTDFPHEKSLALLQRIISWTTLARDYVMDYFGGSGSTAHAAIAMPASMGGPRKFLISEMARYFDEILLPRLKRFAYTPEWKDGKPKRLATPEEADRSPRIMKIVRLESYEDTLNNLDIRRNDTQKSLLDEPAAKGDGRLREQYLLKYMLDVETRGSQSLLNVAAFRDPTAYRLSVKRPESDESREVCVDLLETFNWLIGLTVEAIAAPQVFSASFERDTENRLQLKGGRIKADPSGPFWFRRVEGKLPDGRKALVVWRKLGDDLEQANLVLDHFLTEKLKISTKDFEFDVIYVNGSNNLENLKAPDDTWKVRLLEEEFHRLMFATEDV
jgi:adenine-specific DNA-methyltransferase